MAMGLSSDVCGGGVTTSNQTQTTTQSEYLHLKADTAFDLILLLGKDFKTLNIPEEAIEYIGSHPFTVYYDTTFMDKPVSGASLAVSYDYPTKVDLVKKIYLTIKEPQFMQAKNFLDSKLGECYYSGTEPYVAVNGGAVTHFTYYKEGLKYHLSMGSANSYYSLGISQDEPKGAPNRQSTGLGLLDLVNNNSSGNGMASMPTMTPPFSAPSLASEFWICDECGFTKNKGKFCVECGHKK